MFFWNSLFDDPWCHDENQDTEHFHHPQNLLVDFVLILTFKIGFNNKQTENFQMYKLDSEKAEEPKIKLQTYVES